MAPLVKLRREAVACIHCHRLYIRRSTMSSVCVEHRTGFRVSQEDTAMLSPRRENVVKPAFSRAASHIPSVSESTPVLDSESWSIANWGWCFGDVVWSQLQVLPSSMKRKVREDKQTKAKMVGRCEDWKDEATRKRKDGEGGRIR